MSKEARLKLEAELKHFKYTERPRILDDIRRAREHGDLSENAEYHAAKEAQTLLERKIADLEDKLSRARLIDTDSIPTDKVYLYAKVKIRDGRTGEKIEYKIVSPEEADPDNDIISIQSPIGAALLGKAVGESVEIQVPAGVLMYTIEGIGRD
jgi:transcription elongation factor GreA